MTAPNAASVAPVFELYVGSRCAACVNAYPLAEHRSCAETTIQEESVFGPWVPPVVAL